MACFVTPYFNRQRQSLIVKSMLSLGVGSKIKQSVSKDVNLCVNKSNTRSVQLYHVLKRKNWVDMNIFLGALERAHIIKIIDWQKRFLGRRLTFNDRELQFRFGRLLESISVSSLHCKVLHLFLIEKSYPIFVVQRIGLLISTDLIYFPKNDWEILILNSFISWPFERNSILLTTKIKNSNKVNMLN